MSGKNNKQPTIYTPIKKQKRPYRRTKRPKGYNDKSTVTTTTVTPKKAHVNVYDAVLQESRDLMLAAHEAQQLGRLKMAAAYQLLLHARLVGLGKRFDKAQVTPDENAAAAAAAHATPANPTPGQKTPTPGVPSAASLASTATDGSQQQQQAPPTPTTAAARELAKMLPGNIEMDQTMMEHLAKAAAELHAARSGRKRPWTEADEPLTADEFFRQTKGPGNNNNNGTGNSASSSAAAAGTGIAWSAYEIAQLEKAVADGCTSQQIAVRVQKSEVQVKAYMRNQNARSKIDAVLELPDGSPKVLTKKGRGRKPATTAISTVPDATCDARALLSGKGLLKES